MIDITSSNLEADLIQASLDAPILLDIWAPWCAPCKALGPVLEKLEVSYAGRFTLAKLNSDVEPEVAAQLSQMFGVRSIPFCVLFKGGQPIDGFVGALPEAEIRQFLDKHVPTPAEVESDEEVVAATAMLADGDTTSAIDKLQAALAANPANDSARADVLRTLLADGRIGEARTAYAPVVGQVIPDARLVAYGHWLDACEKAPSLRTPDALAAAIAINKRDFDARFELAQQHFAAQRFTDAMDALLEIVMRDKAWNGELARKTYVAILQVMGKPAPAKAEAAAPKGTLELAGKISAAPADPVVDAYRRKLSMALF
jgi:putative thioredoxin